MSPGRVSGPGLLSFGGLRAWPGSCRARAGAAAEREADVGGEGGEVELALRLDDAAHGETAQPRAFLQVGEPALGQRGTAAVEAGALAGAQVVVHLVAGVIVPAVRA